MSYLNTTDHEIRRLVATSTTDTLVRYVEDAVYESYTRGYANGWHRREDATIGTLLAHHLRRSLRRFVRRLRA